MDNPLSSNLQARIPLSLLKEFLIQSVERSASITQATSIHSSDWEEWEAGLRVWRETLGHLEESSLRLLLADKDLWDAAIGASPDPLLRDRISDEQTRDQWKDIPPELERERGRWVRAGLISSDPFPSTQWPVFSLVELANRHRIEWKDPQERFAQAFGASIPLVCEAILKAHPGLDIQAILNKDAKTFVATGNNGKPLSTLLFSETHLKVSLLLRDQGALDPALIQGIQAQESSILHQSSRDINKARSLLSLGADPDALDERGLLADETEWFDTQRAAEFHALLQSHRSDRSARIARKRIMASALAKTPFSTLNELGFFQKATEDPVVPSEVGDMGLLSFMHHRYKHSSQTRLATIVRILSGKRRAERVLQAEGSREEGLAAVMGLLARESDVSSRFDALRKAFKPLLKGVDVNRALTLALRQHAAFLHSPEILDVILSAMGDKMNDRPLLKGMDIEAWEAFRDALPAHLRWTPPNGARAQQQGQQNVWTRTAEAMMAVLEEHEEQFPLENLEKAKWLPCLMTLACGTREEKHPIYSKAMKWMDEGIEPAWPDPETEERISSWMGQKYPGFEAEVASRAMEKKIPQAKAVSRPRASRF